MRVIEYLILNFVYIIQNIAVSSNMNMALLTTRDQIGGAEKPDTSAYNTLQCE